MADVVPVLRGMGTLAGFLCDWGLRQPAPAVTLAGTLSARLPWCPRRQRDHRHVDTAVSGAIDPGAVGVGDREYQVAVWKDGWHRLVELITHVHGRVHGLVDHLIGTVIDGVAGQRLAAEQRRE